MRASQLSQLSWVGRLQLSGSSLRPARWPAAPHKHISKGGRNRPAGPRSEPDRQPPRVHPRPHNPTSSPHRSHTPHACGDTRLPPPPGSPVCCCRGGWCVTDHWRASWQEQRASPHHDLTTTMATNHTPLQSYEAPLSLRLPSTRQPASCQATSSQPEAASTRRLAASRRQPQMLWYADHAGTSPVLHASHA